MKIGESHARVVKDVARLDRADRYRRGIRVGRRGNASRTTSTSTSSAGCKENANRWKEHKRKRMAPERRSTVHDGLQASKCKNILTVVGRFKCNACDSMHRPTSKPKFIQTPFISLKESKLEHADRLNNGTSQPELMHSRL